MLLLVPYDQPEPKAAAENPRSWTSLADHVISTATTSNGTILLSSLLESPTHSVELKKLFWLVSWNPHLMKMLVARSYFFINFYWWYQLSVAPILSDKYPNILKRQMEVIVFIILQIFFVAQAVLTIGEYFPVLLLVALWILFKYYILMICVVVHHCKGWRFVESKFAFWQLDGFSALC